MAKESYKQIFRATSIFGGVQILNIIIAVFRSKVIAVLIGSTGMGMIGLLNSTIQVIKSLTNFGLSTAAVKNIATAYSSQNYTRLGITTSIFKKLIWLTGSLGFILTLIFAPLLSRIVFGNYDYTFIFMLISVSLLLAQLMEGNIVILRGMRKIRAMAKATVLGSLAGLITSIPLYYYFEEKGIAPAIVTTSIITFVVTYHFSKKIEIPFYAVSKKVLFREGKEMLRFGFLINISGLIALIFSFLVRIFINSSGSLHDVGLYIAGFSLINTYVGMVFTAMSTDYYPRLSSVALDNSKCREEINQQVEIALLILAPLISFFLLLNKYIIPLLYSNEFLSISPMVVIAAIGLLFKASSWAVAYIFMAKGDGRIYFWNELIANLYLFGLNILGYHLFSLTGLGISFLLGYLLYFLQVYYVSYKLYHFHFYKDFYIILIFQFTIVIIIGYFIVLVPSIIGYITSTTLALVLSFYSLKKLNNKIDLLKIFKLK